jgi:hypothetical protein
MPELWGHWVTLLLARFELAVGQGLQQRVVPQSLVIVEVLEILRQTRI